MESLEDRIETWIERMEDDKVFSTIIDQLETRNAELLGYLYLPQFEDLTEDEGSYLLFLASLIYAAVTDGGKETLAPVTLDHIQELEDKNWKMWEALPGKSFDEKVSRIEDDFWDPVTDFIVSMLENDTEVELNWPPAIQEIFFVSLITFYEAMDH